MPVFTQSVEELLNDIVFLRESIIECDRVSKQIMSKGEGKWGPPTILQKEARAAAYDQEQDHLNTDYVRLCTILDQAPAVMQGSPYVRP